MLQLKLSSSGFLRSLIIILSSKKFHLLKPTLRIHHTHTKLHRKSLSPRPNTLSSSITVARHLSRSTLSTSPSTHHQFHLPYLPLTFSIRASYRIGENNNRDTKSITIDTFHCSISTPRQTSYARYCYNRNSFCNCGQRD